MDPDRLSVAGDGAEATLSHLVRVEKGVAVGEERKIVWMDELRHADSCELVGLVAQELCRARDVGHLAGTVEAHDRVSRVLRDLPEPLFALDSVGDVRECAQVTDERAVVVGELLGGTAHPSRRAIGLNHSMVGRRGTADHDDLGHL